MVFGLGKKAVKGSKPIAIYELYTDDTPEGKRYLSPFCWAIRMAVAHKGLPVETIPWEFQEGEKIKFSGQGKVPVIIDNNKDGKWVNDSWAIAKYLENTYPDRPTLFNGPAGEAEALFVQKWMQGHARFMMKLNVLEIHNKLPPKLQPWFRQSREAMFKTKLEEFVASDSERPGVVSEFQAALEPLRATLAEFPWLGGKEGPNYADMYVMSFFMFAYAISPVKLLEESDPIHAWRNRMFAHYDSVLGKAVGYKESL